MSTVHVAICFSDATGEYYKHALVTAYSVFANTKAHVCLHIVHDDSLSVVAQTAFVDLCAVRGQELRLYAAEEIPEDTERNVLAKLGRGALFRTMLPRLIDAGKILYMDCDVVCNADVVDIWDRDLSSQYLAASPLTGKQLRNHSKRLKLCGQNAVNSGVMLMNLEKIRQDIPDYAEHLWAVIKGHKEPVGDQGAVNIFFDNRPEAFAFLPERFNFRTGQKDYAILPFAEYKDKIIHFVDKKPWKEFTLPALWYWKYYTALFPEEDVVSKMLDLAPYEQEYLLAFLLRHDTLRRWVGRLREAKENGFWTTLKRRVTRI